VKNGKAEVVSFLLADEMRQSPPSQGAQDAIYGTLGDPKALGNGVDSERAFLIGE